jgi:hypothetical protein
MFDMSLSFSNMRDCSFTKTWFRGDGSDDLIEQHVVQVHGDDALLEISPTYSGGQSIIGEFFEGFIVVSEIFARKKQITSH